MAIRNPDPAGREETCESSFRAPPPADFCQLLRPTTLRPRPEADPGRGLRGFPAFATERSGQRRRDKRSGVAIGQPPKADRARSKHDGMARSSRNRHLPAHSRNAHRLRSCGRSPRSQSPASSVPSRSFGTPARFMRSDRSSSSRAGKGAAPPSPAPRRAPASVRPATGNWRSCQMTKHIAPRHRPSASLLRQRRVVDDKKHRLYRRRAIGLVQQFSLQRSLSQTPAATKWCS